MNTKINSRPRLLLSAYQCAPEMGSVSHIGWQWYSRLAKRLPVTLITHIRNKEALLKAGAPFPNSEIVFIDTEWFARPFYQLISKLFPRSEYAVSLFSSLDFYVYDIMAVNQLQKRQRAGEQWALVHQVTPVSPKAATRLHTLNCPVVLGPWNGGLTLPFAFPKVIFQDINWLYPIRYLGDLIDGLWQSTQHASMILTATEATLESISEKFHTRCHHFLENGVDLELFKPAPWPSPPSATQPLHILFVGRLVAFKGIPMLLEALARLKDQRPLKLTIIGSGSREPEWRQVATRLKLDNLVTWYGAANHAQIITQLHEAHVLCLPSVRESGGSVLLEAMACARPVLTVNYGGPKEIVDEHVGCAVPPNGPAAITEALVNCLNDIFEHPDLWRQRSEAARRRAEILYDWEVKMDRIIAIYQELLREQAELSSNQKIIKTKKVLNKVKIA